ncbi:hypothetical protein E6C60_2255 [Paenibacillus algicola]|uniref:ABC transmembrane type-1 domain-containing protein n=1 Tax=Paenibacillus algicola TaxID=2565926 RepID=A0A4P8XKM7_9BACL|nr:ABC transporter permease subunit [Paenibacillus algicola]QCT02968.1 hypothetical protein E6C60_2255 [Paenibacillus algicola]
MNIIRYSSLKQRSGYAGVFLLLLAVFILPFVPLLIWSFSLQWRFPELLPVFSLRAWSYVFSSHSQVWTSILNSLGLAAATSVISQLVAYPAARALGLYIQRGNRWIRLALIAPILIPGIAIAVGVHVFFLQIGLSDSWLGVLLAHLIPAAPYSIYLLYGFYAGYDSGYEKQLRLLGATRWQSFVQAELPLLKPVLTLSILFSFLNSWSQYLFTLFIGGGSLITLPMLLFSTLSSGDYSLMGALSMVFVIPALLVVIYSARETQVDQFAEKGEAA